MKAAETSIITVNQGDFVIHMSIADKESNTGFVFNERLLVLKEGLFFGYISKFDIKKDDPKKIDLNQVKDKSKILIKQIKAIEHDEQNLNIKFTHIEKNRQQTKKWAFKLANPEMVKKWVYLLQEQKAQQAARSAQKKSRSRQANSLNSSKANIIVPKINQTSPEKNPNAAKNEPQEQPRILPQNSQGMDVIEDSQSREFVNPLYGYDSVQSDIPRKPVNNLKKPPEPKKVPQPIKPTVQLPSPRKNVNVSPKRQNNFIKKQPQQDRAYGKNSPQKSNIQFKKSPEKYNEQIQQQRTPTNQQNNLFSKKPRESYAEMMKKIVKDCEQRTFERMRERASYQQGLDSQGSSKELYVNGVLEEFIRYDVGETQKWREENMREEEWESKGEKRSQNRLTQLQQLQQLALDIQKQQRTINLQHLNPKPVVNYTDFSKQIALMLRNKRFQRQGHDDLSPQKQNTNPQIDIKSMPFSYRYLLSTSPNIPVNEREEDMMDVLVDWKGHCEDMMKKIVADMVQQGDRFKVKTKKNNIMYFELEDVQVKIAVATLKTVHFQVKDSKNPSDKGKQKKEEKISDYSSAKDLEVEFKNYCALNELLEKSELPLKIAPQSNDNSGLTSNFNHSSRLKTPLTSVVQYFGFVALFKLCPKFQYRPDRINQAYIKQKQQSITQMTNIEVKWLEQGSAKGQNPNEEPGHNKTSIFHIDQNYYAQLHLQRGQLKTNAKALRLNQDQRLTEAKKIFDVDVLQEIDCFLLKDYLTKSLSNGILRKELIDEMIKREQYKDTVLVHPQKVTNTSSKSKIQADLTLFSGQVLEKLSVIILKLDNMSFYYLHPQQISDLFHKEGVNVRYMGLAFDNVSQVYAKKCLMTEITARVSKLLLRKTLQQVLLQNQQPSDKLSSPVKSSKAKRQQSGQTDITYDVIDILNCILGSSPESTAIWAILSQHSQYYFKCELSKDLIDPGYLVASLAYHCKLEVNWKKLSHVGEVFKREDFFRHDSLLGLKAQSKTYEPFSSKLYSSLQRIMGTNKNMNQSPKQQTFRELVQKLNLSSTSLPQSLQCLPDASCYSILSIKQLLAEFIRPQTIKLQSSSSNFGHLGVFSDLNQFPQKKSLSIKISQIKWYLRLKKKEKYLKKFQQLVNMLSRFYGDFSPALGQLYDVFTNFHLTNCQHQDAITFAKSSLVNTLKICGTNHIKTAESYYNLSICYLKANKPQDASNLLKKAKSIYQSRQRVTTEAYANINLKLGLIMLTKNEIKEAIVMVSKALDTFEEVQEFQEEEQAYLTVKQNLLDWKVMFENEKTECYETLARCYELSNNKKQTLIKNLKIISTKINETFLQSIQQPSNVQKVLRLILTPQLHLLTAQQAAIYIDVISALTTAHPVDISPKSYHRAYNLLKSRIKQKTLVQNIQSYLENSSSICDYIMLNNVLQEWKPFEKLYERETINDFVAVTEELVYFLGEGFVTGVLREVIGAKNAQ